MSTEPVSNRVLITGGASGIGFATARHLGRAGAHVGVAFLCSGQADFITGSVLTIDGGMTATFPVRRCPPASCAAYRIW
jgi:NAD(P)-dependent dehydrogenase (short-subunit alcohol dehydrogenase family)